MDELVELLWDRGTVVVQGQSSRRPNADVTGTGYSYKSPSFGDGAVLAAHETKEVKKMIINKDAAGGNPARIMQFDDDSPESLLDPEFFSLPGTEPMDRPQCDVRVAADVDVDADTGRVPWIDYPILDSSENHCTGNKAGELPPSNLLNSNPPLPQPPSLPPKAADVRAAVPVHKSDQDINNVSCSVKKPPHLHLEGGGLGVGLVNFSHFLRPVVLAEATLQSTERLRSNEKASTSYNNSSRLESIVIQSASTLPPPAKPSALPKPQIPLPSIHQNKDAVANGTNNHYRDGNNYQATPASLHPAQRTEIDQEKERVQKAKEREKNAQQAPEAPPASVCSINVDPKQKLKRKSLEDDNATNSDEDVQDESVGLTRSSSSKSKGIKRGRTAEVHNLSERRRRDRINEKMRALQELIPNCNKVDKASMLDEAIEYLKTLQLQVQMMMMMGNGMCISPMMVPPPGLHHMPLAAYPQMGMGIGIGMGMNMGMGYGFGMAPAAAGGDMINHHHPVIRTPHLAPPMNFMPVINGAVFPFDNGIPPPAPTSFGPQVERRHGNSSSPAQSGEVGVNRNDTSNNGETVKSATRSWS